jgi:bla regulator protein BlaR1
MAAIVLLVLAVPLIKNNNNIIHTTVSNTNEPETSVILKDINTDKYQGKLLEIKNPKKINIGYSLKGNKPDKNISEVVKASGAIAAINAGAFMDTFDNKGGIIIHEGKVVYNDLKEDKINQNIVGFNNKGGLVNGKYTVNEITSMNLQEAVSFDDDKNLDFGIPLISSGNKVTLNSTSQVREPRTAIAQKLDGTILMVVINGRNIKSMGITVSELQKLFVDEGAIDASTLAGGSHSEMFYQDKIVNQQQNSTKDLKEMSYFMVMP